MSNNNNYSKTNNVICEAVECSEYATEIIDITAGKFGTLSLSLCKKCVGKFVTHCVDPDVF